MTDAARALSFKILHPITEYPFPHGTTDRVTELIDQALLAARAEERAKVWEIVVSKWRADDPEVYFNAGEFMEWCRQQRG